MLLTMWPADFIPLFHPDDTSALALPFAFCGEDLLLDTQDRLPDATALAALGAPAAAFVFGTTAGRACRALRW
ncbi:MAG: NADH pyrophosphatase, partial [Candidatus Dactylopiibacterium sp.]|nr:NADH pyrophosphatase [Candidatus Dactylopiibacterium sp.]